MTTILDSLRIIQHLRDPRFAEWRKAGENEKISEFLSEIGLTVQQYIDWHKQYQLWYAEGCRLAEFTVAYGYPPDKSTRTRDLLALVAPYALAIKSRIIHDAMKDSPHQLMLSTYYGGDQVAAEKDAVERALRSMMK